MARDGSGGYSAPTNSWNPAVNGASATTSDWQSLLNDLVAAMAQSVSKDGQTTMTGALPMGSNKITGLASGTSATDAVAMSQLQNSSAINLSSVSGTNTITASLANPTLTAYASGQIFTFIAANTITGAATININSLGAKSITKYGTNALVANDIVSGQLVEIVYDGTQFQMIGANPGESEGAAVSSASTTNIWSTGGGTAHITGTTTITSFGTAPQAGAWMKVIFDGALTLTHGANLSLPGSANITTAADDFAFVYADTTTQFDVLYFKKDGTPVVGGIGYGQTWQDVTASRASGTTYTNTTTKPIQVNISAAMDGVGVRISLAINGVAVDGQAAYAVNAICAISAIIPPGNTYALSGSGGSVASLTKWYELR